jgi:hypothetical protein
MRVSASQTVCPAALDEWQSPPPPNAPSNCPPPPPPTHQLRFTLQYCWSSASVIVALTALATLVDHDAGMPVVAESMGAMSTAVVAHGGPEAVRLSTHCLLAVLDFYGEVPQVRGPTCVCVTGGSVHDWRVAVWMACHG